MNGRRWRKMFNTKLFVCVWGGLYAKAHLNYVSRVLPVRFGFVGFGYFLVGTMKKKTVAL